MRHLLFYRCLLRKWPLVLASLTLVGFASFLYLRPVNISLFNNPLRLPGTSGVKLPPLLTDGVFVYFQESQLGKLGITAIPLAGGPATSLRLPLDNPDPGVVSPDGRAMLLRSIQGNKDGDEPLYLQPLSGAPPTRLGDIRAYDSAWMPDGRHIVYSHRRAVYQTLLENLATAGSLSE